ncbi:hypothetical protein [Saccharothrix syringae]|uniref:DNA-binding protein n=1 Tax=Saccharothrix syringae TaxID=103733 RepID=A0A5Q0GZV3_SACSY|nr:hypothetical protein [Saccharothrix syringae]QFZ19459.1 hypothetical protein EKG83_20235 [Saccharothrix syringae]
MDDKALINAGAVLPGTGTAGEDRDAVTARHYTHPALDDRVVVRLTPAVLGAAEDLTCEYLGFAAPARVAEVGTGRRSALGFPAWALVHDPANAHHALNLVKDVERLARTAKSRAGAAKDGFTALGDMLGRSAPHFLPTFYEQAGRIFLEHGNQNYAASMFGKAREAERVHDLAVDPERTREVFLEFAFAGALTAKALSEYSKSLARKHDPDSAYELFLTLCVERTRGGLPPYTGMPEDLRRLAKAAKRTARAEDERLLRAILDSAAINRAGAAFWKSYRDSLVSIAKADAGVRARLLAFVPDSTAALDPWFDLLDECGATRALTGPPGEVPADPAGWLASVLAVRSGGWRETGRSTRLLDLVGRMVDRLVADGVPVRALRSWRQGELDLLDLLVAHGVPIAAGKRWNNQFDVDGWLGDQNPGRRDLTALAASERFVGALAEGLVSHFQRHAGQKAVDAEALGAAVAVPGLRTALRHWLTERAARVTATGLPDLERHLSRLAVVRLPEAFADVPEAAEAIARTDVAAAVHRTLRAGLFDEVGWPALDEAVARLDGTKGRNATLSVRGEGWPALVLRAGEDVVVVGPDGVLAEHVLRVPADARARWGYEPTAYWFDGVLLVRWHGPEGELAYWSDAPDRIFAPTGTRYHYTREVSFASIAMPDGARFTGRRVVHPGDTGIPVGQAAFGDGVNLWTLEHDDRWRWREVAPATGELGRAGLPRFLEDFALDGASLELDRCDLRPAVPATADSLLGTADGLHGWRVRREADRSWTGEGIDGRRVRLPADAPCPIGVLRLPGADLPLGEAGEEVVLLAEDGTELGRVTAGGHRPRYAAGTPVVPPGPWWHLLRPRDEAGSAALRAVTRQAVDDLLAVALAGESGRRTVRARLDLLARGERDELCDAVVAALPGITDQALVLGVADVVHRAADVLRSYRGYAEVAEAAREVGPRLAPTGPAVTAQDVEDALDWFAGRHSYRSPNPVPTTLPRLITALGEAAARTEAGPLPESQSSTWFRALPNLAALLHRAASPLTPDEERDALVLVLRCLADSGLADGHWREVGVLVPPGQGAVQHRVLPVGDGFLALFTTSWTSDPGTRLDGLQFTRTPGRYELPRDWRLTHAHEPGTPLGAGRVHRFLDALAERGPAPWRPEAVPALAEAAGLGTAEATVLLAGMPGVTGWEANYLDPDHRRLLGLSAAAAKAAKARLRSLDTPYRHRLLAAAVPADPVELWTRGPDVAAVAEVWTARHGRLVPVPDDVLEDAVRQLGVPRPAEYVTGVVNPDLVPWLTTDANLRLDGTELVGADGEAFDRAAMWIVPQVLLWLAQRLPAGSPLRARLPEALAQVRRRVAHPGFAVELNGWTPAADVRALLGIDAPPTGTAHRHRDWLDVITVQHDYCRFVVRPGLVGPRDRPLLELLAEVAHGDDVLRALDLLADDGLTAACAAGAPEGVDPAAYHQDPTTSAPHLVAEVAGRFDLPEDAAVLYLQLLALPDPTDANVARWTGWKPARLRAARTALAGTDLVLTAKRARAGRSLFLPGGWLALTAPHLPLEAWKAPMFGYTGDPRAAIVPREPVADLFARAWRRVLDGDAPAYEELKTGGRR